MRETIVINSKNEMHFIKQCEILYCQSENYATHIVKSNDQKITAAKPLSTFLKLLDKTLFVRISQSYLVNSMHIVKIDKKECTVLLANGDTIPYTISIKQWVNRGWAQKGQNYMNRLKNPCKFNMY